MYDKFYSCPECKRTDYSLSTLEWESFVNSKGKFVKKAYLMFSCCPKVKIEIKEFRQWAEFESWRQDLRRDFWEELGKNGLLSDDIF